MLNVVKPIVHHPHLHVHGWYNQWIGLRENLQESPTFHGKITLVSGEDFPVSSPIHCFLSPSASGRLYSFMGINETNQEIRMAF